MAQVTKAALQQQVADMAAQINVLQAALAQATHALEQAQAQLEASTTPSRRIVAAGYVAPAWQAERAAAMAAAKAAAVRLGVTTKVAAC